MKRILMNVRLYGVVALLLILVSCENPILFQVEKDVFRATSEKFARVVLRNGLTVVETGGEVRFSDTAIGGTPHVEGFSIENGGDYQLELKSISFTGTNADSFSLDEPSIAVLDPGDQTSFSITFDPVGDPGIQSASMVVEYEGGEQDSVEFTLSGEAYGGVLQEIQLFYNDEKPDPDELVQITYDADTPPTIQATRAVAADSSDTFTFTVKNLGQNDLSITNPTNLEVADTDLNGYFTVNAPAVSTLGESTAYETTFTVEATFGAVTTRGPKSVTIQIDNNDDNEGAFEFVFEVVASAPEVAVSVGGSSRTDGGSYLTDFNWRVDDDGDLTIPVTVTNILSLEEPLENASLSFTSASTSNTADFTLVGDPASAVSIPAGDSEPFALVVSATTDKDYTTTLTINSDDPDEGTFTVDVTVNADTPQLEVSATVDGIPVLVVNDGDTITLPRTSSEVIVTLGNTKGGVPLHLSVPWWRDDATGGYKSDFLGLPVENEIFLESDRYAFGYDEGKLVDAGGVIGTGKSLDIPFRFNESLTGEYYYRERVELHTDDYDDRVFTFFVAVGRPTVLGFGHSAGMPAVWAIDPTVPDIVDFTRYEEVRGEIFGAFVGDGRATLYGTSDVTGDYEATYYTFDLGTFKITGHRLVEYLAEGSGSSAIMDAIHDGAAVYTAGFTSEAPIEPASHWWDPKIVPAGMGFFARGDGLDAITLLKERPNSAAYDLAAVPYEYSAGAWAAGTSRVTDDGEAFMWRTDPPGGDSVLLQDSDPGAFEAALGAAGGSSFTLVGGHKGGEAAYWVYDRSDEKTPQLTEGALDTPAGPSFVFGVDEAGASRHSFVGLENGEPALWTGPIAGVTLIGKGDGGIAFDVVDHGWFDSDVKEFVSARIVAGDYAGFPFFWTSRQDASNILVDDRYEGEINRLLPYSVMDFYRWQK